MFRVYVVSETAQAELKSERVYMPLMNGGRLDKALRSRTIETRDGAITKKLDVAAGAYTRPLFTSQGGQTFFPMGNDAQGGRTCAFTEWGGQRGLTLVNYSAQPEPFRTLKFNNHSPKNAYVKLKSG